MYHFQFLLINLFFFLPQEENPHSFGEDQGVLTTDLQRYPLQGRAVNRDCGRGEGDL